ncbi:MAG: hypothetical protein V1809_07245 [Planctomycetota bacterium]
MNVFYPTRKGRQGGLFKPAICESGRRRVHYRTMDAFDEIFRQGVKCGGCGRPTSRDRAACYYCGKSLDGAEAPLSDAERAEIKREMAVAEASRTLGAGPAMGALRRGLSRAAVITAVTSGIGVFTLGLFALVLDPSLFEVALVVLALGGAAAGVLGWASRRSVTK